VRDAKLGQCLRSINFLTRREQVGSLTLRLFHCLQQLPRLPLGPQPDLAGAGANVGPLEQPRGDRHDDARRGNEGQPLKVERPFDAAANSAFSPDPGHHSFRAFASALCRSPAEPWLSTDIGCSLGRYALPAKNNGSAACRVGCEGRKASADLIAVS
jgi:hypothetical protein